MRRKYGKILCIFLSSILLTLIGIARGDDVKTHYISSKPLVLHSLPSDESYHGHYNSFGVFVDANNRIITLYSYEYGKKSFMSVFDGKKWGESSASIPFSKGMVNNGTFQVYRYEADRMRIYSLSSDLKLSSQPTNTIKDNSRKAIWQLLPLMGDPDKFFAVGVYTESRLNPFNLLPFLWSGGHGTRAEKLFGATVEKDEVTGYYDVPGPVEENEYVSDFKSIIGGNKVHVVWIKGIQYVYYPAVIKYSSFDLANKRWSEPEELCRGVEVGDEVILGLGLPSVACDKENVYCAWPQEQYDFSDLDKKTINPKMESGIYFRGKTNGYWDKPVKLDDSSSDPRVIIDNYGTVYVFWIEGSSLLYKYKTGTDWSSRCLAVEDKEISNVERGFPPFEFLPISISVDQDNNLHIVYIHKDFRASKNQERKYKPEEIVYVKLTYQK